MSQLRSLATAFRAAIERTAPSERLITLHQFPSGSCGEASLLLAHFLLENGFSGIEYVSGTWGSHAHGWLEVNGAVIDISADQFNDNPEMTLLAGLGTYALGGVIVTQDRSWHSHFEETNRHIARIDIYDDSTRERLLQAYRGIVSNLPKQLG